MHSPTEISNTLVKYYQKLPLWGKVLVVAGGAGFLVFGLALDNMSGSPTGPTGDSTGLAIGVFLKFSIVVVLILGITIVAHRYLNGAGKGRMRQMKVVETLSLSPRRALHLVKVGNQTLLIGATDQSIALISPIAVSGEGIAEPKPQAETTSIPVRFDDLFAAAQTSLEPTADKGAHSC